jgi:hypothetical protein
MRIDVACVRCIKKGPCRDERHHGTPKPCFSGTEFTLVLAVEIPRVEGLHRELVNVAK